MEGHDLERLFFRSAIISKKITTLHLSPPQNSRFGFHRHNSQTVLTGNEGVKDVTPWFRLGTDIGMQSGLQLLD